MTVKLSDLLDVNDEDKGNNYLIMYNATTKTWVAKNPDEVLKASSIEPTQPGIPQEFTDELNNTLVPTLEVDLDNQIDVDAGEF